MKKFLFVTVAMLVAPFLISGAVISKDSDSEDPWTAIGGAGFEGYQRQVQQICNQNRRCYFPLKKPVRIHCFVTEAGVVRDPQIVLSSGMYSHDLSCIDALLCSSPLSAPPRFRRPLPPPGFPSIDVDSLSAGPIEVDFPPDNEIQYRTKEWLDEKHLPIPLIPWTITEQCPKSFSIKELSEDRNFFEPDPTGTELSVETLIRLRYPWTEFFQNHKSATRQEILDRLNDIQTLFGPVKDKPRWKDRWASNDAHRSSGSR